MLDKNTKEFIALKKQNFKGENTDVEIKDLLLYENLKGCNLYHFVVNDEDITHINKLSRLQNITFDLCYFQLKYLSFNDNIKRINFNLCENIKMEFLKRTKTKSIEIIQWEKANIELNLLEMEYAENLEELAIHNCKIKGIEKILEIAPKLKKLNLDGSYIENKSILMEFSKMIDITNELKFYQEEI